MDPRLHKAAREGKIELLTSIMEGDSPPDRITFCLTPQKNTALHIAVRFVHQTIMKKMIQLQPSLISQPNSKGETPLHMAASAGHFSLTKLLTPTSEEGASSRELGSAALRTKNMDGSTAIHEALKKGHKKVALHLLIRFDQRMGELARDVNFTGESLLYLPAEAGLEEVVTEIMDMGNFRSKGHKQTPLHIGVIKGPLGNVSWPHY